MNAHTGETALIREEMETKTRITNKLTRENIVKKVSVLLCTVTFYANLAHSLTRSP